MKPEVAAAWQTIRDALREFRGTVSQHEEIWSAAAVIEHELAPPETPAPSKKK